MFYFLGVALALVGFIMVVVGWQQAQSEAPEAVAARLSRLRERRETLSPKAQSERERDRDFARREEARAKEARRTTTLPSLSNLFSTNKWLLRLEEDLTQSRSQWRASELVASSVILCVVVFIILSFIHFWWFLALPISLLCLGIPWWYVKIVKYAYYRRFDEQLADTLLLMANSLKAGFSFLQSVDMVGRESLPPIADEFTRINQEISIGVSVPQALDNLAARIPSVDVNLMVTAVIIQREVGGSLSEILESISAVIRERMRLKREVRVLTTQGRATGAILGCLPVLLGLALHLLTKMENPGEPSFIEPMFHVTAGVWMLVGAGIMQVIGFCIIWKIVSIKV